MQHQVVLLASSTETPVTAWDLQTGTHLTSYKTNSCPRNGMCCVGSDYLLAAQTGKDALQFWTWHKDQVQQRSFAMERIMSVAATSDGALIAGGGASGAVYIWETGSGRLVRSWAAHYKAVTALAFTSCSSVLVTGAEDTLVHAWVLSDLLDSSLDPSSPAFTAPQPLHAWSDHTLPVTSIVLSAGGCSAAAVVVSASLDRSVCLHRLSDGCLLAKVALPAAALAVVMDAGEHAMYVGCSDGCVCVVSLVGEGASSAQGGAASMSAHEDASLSASSVLRVCARLASHTKAVNALAMSVDGELLVSASDDGTAIVWDLRSQQPVRTIQSTAKTPITSLLVLPTPPHLVPSGGGAGASAGARGRSGSRLGPKRLQPLAPLSKYAGMQGSVQPWETAHVVLDGSGGVQGVGEVWGCADSVEGVWAAHRGQGVQGGVQGSDGSLAGVGVRGGSSVLEGEDAVMADADLSPEEKVVALEAELAAARRQAAEYKSLHGQLLAFATSTLSGQA